MTEISKERIEGAVAAFNSDQRDGYLGAKIANVLKADDALREVKGAKYDIEQKCPVLLNGNNEGENLKCQPMYIKTPPNSESEA